MPRLEVRIVKGGSSHIKLSNLTDLDTKQKVNNAQSVVGTLYERDPADGSEVAVVGASNLALARVGSDPAGQYKAGVPSTATDTLDVGTEVRVAVMVIMPDARRMPFEAFGTVLPAGPSS